MARQLMPEEIVTLLVLKKKGNPMSRSPTPSVSPRAPFVTTLAPSASPTDDATNRARPTHWPMPSPTGSPLTSEQAETDAPERPANVTRPARLVTLRTPLPGFLPLRPAFRPRPLPRPPPSPFPPRRDPAWRTGPGGLGGVRRPRRRRGPPEAVRFRPGAVPLAQGRADLEPRHGPTQLASRPQRGVPSPRRYSSRAADRQPQDGHCQRCRTLGPDQRGLPELRQDRGFPRRCLPATLPRAQGQGGEQGEVRPPPTATGRGRSATWPNCNGRPTSSCSRRTPDATARRRDGACRRVSQAEQSAVAAAGECCPSRSTWP